VYTALIGQYEQLNEQTVSAYSAIPFICLTDDPDLKSESWQIRQVSPVFRMDPIRSQKDFKLRPHFYIPDFDASLYIDNSVLLTHPPESIFERYFPASGICIPEHSFRDSTLDEFLEVARLGFDDHTRIFEQLNHYMLDCPEVLQEKPYWAGILLRDHRNEKVIKMLEVWVAHVQRYSRRDQLSVNVALRHAGLTPDCMKIDNHASWFHSWPHTEGRDRHKGMRSPTSSQTPPVARIRQLEKALLDKAQQHEQALAEQERQHQLAMTKQSETLAEKEQALAELQNQISAFLNSTCWHVTTPLRWFKQRILTKISWRGLSIK
jgi:hypothetical protein